MATGLKGLPMQDYLQFVAGLIERHCQSRGYGPAPWQNPLTPVDSVAAFQMARLLVRDQPFDHYVTVAPEGHVYGFFFETFGVRMLAVEVGYPPRNVTEIDNLSVIRGGRVLILEDDVISGLTLRLVADVLRKFEPASLALFLGRAKCDQQLENVPAEIEQVFLAEDWLDQSKRTLYEGEFRSAFPINKEHA